jgi:hypothetical protein
MNIKTYTTFTLLALLAALCFSTSSCKKFVEIKPSPNLILSDQLFADDASALSAVSGVYLQMRALSPSLANGCLSIYGGLSADELSTYATPFEYDAFYKNSILPTSTVIYSQLWASAYRVIYRTNAIIEGLKKSSGVSASAEKQLIGEMKVVRALYYFYLANLFGEVPLVTTTDYRENDQKPRTPIDEVYQQIIGDLTDATNLLSESYPSPGKLRPNKWTAAALLAKVYLFRNDWQDAEVQASQVIDSGGYALANDLNAVFKTNSPETIWEIAPANESRNTAEGSICIPFSSSTIPTVIASTSLLNAFEPGDLRKTNWLGSNVVGANQYFYPFKYKRKTSATVDEYEIVLRLADQYLIRSEARARQNNLPDAIADLNIVRSRAGLPNTNAADQSSLIAAILKERLTELFAEWGNRWFDLKRTVLVNQVLAPVKGSNWKATSALYPIPFSEIQINTLLTQNPGY